jgi:hypothetical protein
MFLLENKPEVRGRDGTGFLLERKPELILKEETMFLLEKKHEVRGRIRLGF